MSTLAGTCYARTSDAETPVEATGLAGLLAEFSPHPVEKGQQFEALVAWWLRQDPRFAEQVKQVWLWGAWPGKWDSDTGIDAVVEDHEGGLWAVECKCMATTTGKSDVDSFVSESTNPVFTRRLLVTTAAQVSARALRVLSYGPVPVEVLTRSDLATAAVDWPADVEDIPRPPRRLPKAGRRPKPANAKQPRLPRLPRPPRPPRVRPQFPPPPTPKFNESLVVVRPRLTRHPDRDRLPGLLLEAGPRGWTLNEVASRAGLPYDLTQRYLAQLWDAGVLAQLRDLEPGGRRYRVWYRLANPCQARPPRRALPSLADLYRTGPTQPTDTSTSLTLLNIVAP